MKRLIYLSCRALQIIDVIAEVFIEQVPCQSSGKVDEIFYILTQLYRQSQRKTISHE